jgi:tripartite-type tricarboxylate transporter receptor subunit TctC
MKIIVPFPPGGIDLILKALIPELENQLGRKIEMINRAGGTGAVGTLEAAKSAPDGQTLLFASQGPLVYQPQVNALAYDAQRSFVPVCRVTCTPSVLMASEHSGFNDLTDVLAAARAETGHISYSSPGAGGLPHIGMAAFARLMAIELEHLPMAGAAAAITALKQGQAHLIAEQLPTAVALAGKGARIIGVFAAQRLASLRNVPTLSEQGCELCFQSWNALMAPAGTATEILHQLGEACLAALINAAPELYRAMGVDPAYLDSAQTALFIAKELDSAQALIQKSGLKQ